MDPQHLLNRLDEIGRSLAASGHALALIGLGSVGVELDRLDAYSDLDFFAIVEPGYKRAYLADLDWLVGVAPVAYAFLNTEDGYKLLYADGVFCEFAVFEPDELRRIPFAAGRVVWKAVDVPDDLLAPAPAAAGERSPRPLAWLVGEALTNLYVGLGRERRGEQLSAMRFIQGYALDRLLELAGRIEEPQPGLADPFSPERRFEQRYPHTAQLLPAWAQGYHRNRESALAILAYLEEHFEVNAAMAEEIRKLCAS
jgi:hypothetical protein